MKRERILIRKILRSRKHGLGTNFKLRELRFAR